MTGYHMSIGYTATRCDSDAMWDILKREARRVADSPDAIAAEVRRLGGPEVCEDGCCKLATYVEIYLKPFDNPCHPVKIVDRHDERQIMQLASTDAGFKYHVRRAYVRLLIEAMHRHAIEISLSVA